MPTDADIIKAVITIQNTCKNTEDCRRCPFGNQEGYCSIIKQEPIYWTIDADPVKVWRALI